MATPKPEPKSGDPCPNCGSELRELPEPTPEQRAAAANRDNPAVLPRYVDRASAEQRAELGPLARCMTCGYETRFKPQNDNAQANDQDTAQPRRGRERAPAAER